MQPLIRTFPILLLVALLLSVRTAEPASVQQLPPPLWPEEWMADGALLGVWSQTDAPVAARSATRSWIWGPVPFAVANEAYTESPTGRRLTMYLDKGRMEINDPLLDRSTHWFVSSGLLVIEMVTGRMQLGNSTFESVQPASVLVAGDPNSPNAPLYSSFSRHTAPAAKAVGTRSRQAISRDGTLTPIQPDLPPNLVEPTTNTEYDEVTKHNIPAVFVNWARSQGPVLWNGRLVQRQIIDPLYVLGRPVTEAYWADILVKGVSTRVLIQLYERRALTFNPQNPPGWQVEMANVGRAYYDWRYAKNPPGPAIAAEPRPDSVRIRGWNWPPGQTATVQFDLAGGVQPLSGPHSIPIDPNGRFTLNIPPTPQLSAAALVRANIQVRTLAGSLSAALPYGSGLALGPVKLNGEIVAVKLSQGKVSAAALRGRDGKEWLLNIIGATKIEFSEGSAASHMFVAPGVWASAEGTASGGQVTTTLLKLLSVSQGGAQFGWIWQGDGKALHITGTGWPAGKEVTFTLKALGETGGKPFSTGKANSRGILNFKVSAPLSAPSHAASYWVHAVSSDKGSVAAHALLPYEPPASLPPSLILMPRSGEQSGVIGDYCWEKKCVDAVGVPLPLLPLSASPGEVLGMRSQSGPDPEIGITPLRFTARLYPYPDGSTQGSTIGGTFYFAPTTQPLYAVEVPGRPFSITLPTNFPLGLYALLVSATFANSGGVGEASLYGFSLHVKP